ncbi:MAG: antirestriction protein ArdA [Acidobacteria bacterium]|nr:antirestriction protein ArdA [Acidobacteriota bacterium]
MEQHPTQGGDLQATPITNEPRQTAEQSARLSDEQLIHYHITEALREDRPIDHATARCIAAQLHGGQASALYALASSGAVVDGLTTELDSWRNDDVPVELEPWLDALEEYLGSREDKSPIDVWHQLWPTQPERQDGEPPTGDEERLPYGSPASAMGHVAVGVHAERQCEGEHSAEHQEAELQPAESAALQRIREGVAAAQRERREIDHRTARDIARQFKQVPDGALAVFAGCGAIINNNDELFQELYATWQEHTPEQQTWAEALRSYCLGRDSEAPVSYWGEEDERPDIASGDRPEIWVGSLSDYNHGFLHGMWVAADQEPEAIQEQIAWILRTSPATQRYGEIAEEWGIFDYSGFCGYRVDEYASLDTVSLIARGITEHGSAYAGWVEYVGDTSQELLDEESFHDHYEGTYDSLEAYVEYILEETGFYSELDRALAGIPEDIRRYIEVDVEGIAEEWGQGLHVVEAEDGRVHVFGGRG